MTTPDPSIVAAYRQGMARNPVPVTITRLAGAAPHVALVAADVIATDFRPGDL